MARPGVTYLEVAKTAQQIVSAGKIPTIESIRIALGTGSNSTLGTHLRTWKSNQNQTQQIAIKENIPEELIAVLKGLWERVMNQSDEKVQIIHQETQQELVKLKEEVQRLQKDNTYWQQQHQQIKQERDTLIHEKLAIEHLLTNFKIEIATLTERHVGLEQQYQQKQDRIDELHQQNQQIQANLEHYRNASLEQRIADQQRYEQQLKQLEQTIQQINQESTKVQHEKFNLHQENQRVTVENESIKAHLNKLETQYESMTSRLTDTLSELAKTSNDRQHWQKQYQNLLAKYDEQNNLFIEIKSQYAVLLQKNETMKAELNEIQEHNKLLAQEKWELAQEKAQIYGQLKQIESCI
jgi:chromosome segregation ATPase